MILVLKITCSVCKTKRIRVLIYGLFSQAGSGFVGFDSKTLAKLSLSAPLRYDAFLEISEPLDWSVMSCSPSVGINTL